MRKSVLSPLYSKKRLIFSAIILILLQPFVNATNTEPLIIGNGTQYFNQAHVWIENVSGTRYADEYFTFPQVATYQFPYVTNFTLNVAYDDMYNLSYEVYNASWLRMASNVSSYVGRGSITPYWVTVNGNTTSNLTLNGGNVVISGRLSQNNSKATGVYSVALGFNNTASGNGSVVSGGGVAWTGTVFRNRPNIASGETSTVSGGLQNTASGQYSGVGSGYRNIASGLLSTVSGGDGNTASGVVSAITGGGGSNIASGGYSYIGGGNGNTASGHYSAVIGGYLNRGAGYVSTVPGGRLVNVTANFSLAAGYNIQAGTSANNATQHVFAFGRDFTNPTSNSFQVGFGKPTLNITDGLTSVLGNFSVTNITGMGTQPVNGYTLYLDNAVNWGLQIGGNHPLSGSGGTNTDANAKSLTANAGTTLTPNAGGRLVAAGASFNFQDFHNSAGTTRVDNGGYLGVVGGQFFGRLVAFGLPSAVQFTPGFNHTLIGGAFGTDNFCYFGGCNNLSLVRIAGLFVHPSKAPSAGMSLYRYYGWIADSDSFIYADKKILFEGSVSDGQPIVVDGDTYMLYNSTLASHQTYVNNQLITTQNTTGIYFDKGVTIYSNDSLKLSGNATVWDDMVTPIAGVKLPAANAPILTQLGTTGIYLVGFEDKVTANEEEAYGTIQFSHQIKCGSVFECHLHWMPTDTTSGNVLWNLTVSYANISGTFPSSGPKTYQMASASGGTAWKHNVVYFGNIDSGDISGILNFRLRRNSGEAADTYNGQTAIADSFDCHYEIDDLGSRDILLK